MTYCSIVKYYSTVKYYSIVKYIHCRKRKLFLKHLVQVNKRLLKFFEKYFTQKYKWLSWIIKHNKCYNCIRIVLFIASAKIPKWEWSISPSSFYGQPAWLTISHRFWALPTQWVNSPHSRKWRRGVKPRFHHNVLCLVWVKRIRHEEGVQDSLV